MIPILFCVYPLFIARHKFILGLPPEGELDLPNCCTHFPPLAFPSAHTGGVDVGADPFFAFPVSLYSTENRSCEFLQVIVKGIVSLSAWRVGWQLGGGFLHCSSERRRLTFI